MDLLLHAKSDDDAWRAALSRHLPEARVHNHPTTVATDYALVWRPPPEVFAGQRRLKAVFNIGAGVDALLQSSGLPSGVPLIRLEDAGMAPQMVEYVAWGVLGHHRDFVGYADQAKRAEWKSRSVVRAGDFGVGILGLGVIGSAIVEGLRPFGFALYGWSRRPRSLPGVATFAGRDELPRFLDNLRVLVCVLPLTPDTAGLLDRSVLSALPRGAFLINVARGDVVVEPDLLALIESGHLSGALLDVFHEEPLPAEHPFWRHPRILVTPHVSGVTLVEESIAQIAAKIRRLECGEPVGGVVDPVAGY